MPCAASNPRRNQVAPVSCTVRHSIIPYGVYEPGAIKSQRLRDDGVGAPGVGRSRCRAGSPSATATAPHAGGARGLDVAQVVAEVDAILRRAARAARAACSSGAGMRLEVRRGVAAHHAGGARSSPSAASDALGEARRLVGDHAPARGRARSSAASSSAMPGNSARLDADVARRSSSRKAVAQRSRTRRRSGSTPKPDARAGRARRREAKRPQLLERQRRQAALRAQAVQRRARGPARCRRACRRGRTGPRDLVRHAAQQSEVVHVAVRAERGSACVSGL